MARKKEYCVAEGRPSWHQSKAGHGYGSLMCFSNKRSAQAFLRRVRKLRPKDPAFLIIAKETR